MSKLDSSKEGDFPLKAPSITKALFLGARPHTLGAAISPVLIGSSLGALKINYTFYQALPIFALVCSIAVLIQILANYVNDLWDFKSGKDTKNRIGPTRVVQAGLISPNQMRNAIYGLTLLILGLGIIMVKIGGVPLLIIGICSILGAYAYTAGPYPLAYNGLGEIFVLIFFGPVAVMGSEYLYTSQFSLNGFLLGLIIGGVATNLLIVNNTRDIEEDRETGKRTLAARYGLKFSYFEFDFFLFLPVAISAVYFSKNSEIISPIFILALIPFFLILRSKFRSVTNPSSYNDILKLNGKTLLLVAVLLTIGLLQP